MNDFKYKSTFATKLLKCVGGQGDKYLSLASLKELSSFVPDLDLKTNIDLLPIAFNAWVGNRVNRNGDVIDTQMSLDIYKSFINKPINLEHSRQKILGTILSAGFSEFGTDKPLTEEQVKDLKTPFNVTLGGVLWKIVSPEITDRIEESNDEASEYYLSVSCSWELGFSEYSIESTLGDSKNLEDCTSITDLETIASLDKYLKANGGTGKLQDGRSIYRKVIGKVVPLGIGITENPAADVKGIAINVDKPTPDITVTDSSEKISQSSTLDVNINSNKIMKITSLEDINDKTWKELSASAITEFIAENLKKASEEFVASKNEHDEFVKSTQAAAQKMQDEYAGMKTALDSVQAEIAKLQTEKAERAKVDTFNTRMGDVCATYALNEEMAKTIAEQLKKCDTDEDFANYKSNMAVFLKPFERRAAATPCDSKQNKGPTEQTSDTEMKEEEDEQAYAAASVLDKAIDNADKEKASLPNSTETKRPTLLEKYSQAFSLEDGFVVNKNRR